VIFFSIFISSLILNRERFPLGAGYWIYLRPCHFRDKKGWSDRPLLVRVRFLYSIDLSSFGLVVFQNQAKDDVFAHSFCW
jgi:hypothetical protein